MTNEEAIEILKDNIKSLEGHTPFKHTNYKKVQAIEIVINNYLKEKARADKLEKEYSKMLTILDENNLL